MPDHSRRRGTGRPRPPLEHHLRRPDGPGTDDLLVAAGRGDLHALAAFYDTTAPVVFGLLQGVLGDRIRAEQATRRVYLQLWISAASFEPSQRSAHSLLLRTARRELIGRIHEVVIQNQSTPGADAGP